MAGTRAQLCALNDILWGRRTVPGPTVRWPDTIMLYKQTVLLSSVTFLGLTAYIMRLEQLYLMAALLAFVGVGSYAICVFSLRGLEVRRGPTRKASEGEWFDLSLTLTNRSRTPKVFIGLEETLPRWLEADGETRFAVPMLLPGRSVELSLRVRGAKRGAYALGPLAVSATDLLGAFSVERRLEAPQEVIIYPLPARVAPEPLAGLRSFGGVETEQLSAAGTGLEFYGIRDYRPGDALRRIHWPSTARLGHFAVVEFEETFGADVVIVVDLRRGSEFGSGKETTLETAIKAAASLAAFAVENGAAAVVVGQDAQRRYLASARRAEELAAVLEALARMTADGEKPLSEVMRGADELVAGKWAVVLTAAPEEAVTAAVEAWVQRQAQVVAALLDAASWEAESGVNVYDARRGLASAGARVEIFRRGDEVEQFLGRAVSDAA